MKLTLHSDLPAAEVLQRIETLPSERTRDGRSPGHLYVTVDGNAFQIKESAETGIAGFGRVEPEPRGSRIAVTFRWATWPAWLPRLGFALSMLFLLLIPYAIENKSLIVGIIAVLLPGQALATWWSARSERLYLCRVLSHSFKANHRP